jgi:hypothetical protein
MKDLLTVTEYLADMDAPGAVPARLAVDDLLRAIEIASTSLTR